MAGRLRTWLKSLEPRLLLPLAVTIGAVLSVHALLAYRAARGRFFDLVSSEVQRSSSLIQSAAHDGMLLNQLDRVQAMIERLGATPEFEAIRVYDNDGRVVMADRPEQIGRIADAALCLHCHASDDGGAETALASGGLVRDGAAADRVRHLAAIPNEPACARTGCHRPPDEQPVLGVLEVERSMAPYDETVAQAQSHLIVTTILLLLVSSVGAAMFIRRVVLEPTLALERGTQRIAAGDLDTRISVEGQHELARLADAFNAMVADLRVARQQVLASSQQLEEKVAEKTEALRCAQRHVLHMEKMASLGKLSATVAHELNNPISGVLTYARLVRRELDDQPLDESVRAELVRYLTLMQQECARCGDIVHNLLTFARHTGAEMKTIDLDDVIERSLMLVQHHCEMANVEIRRDLAEGDAVVVADAGQIEQALVALLVNAAEAMRDGERAGGTLTVRTRLDPAHVEIDVVDTGVGIPADDLPSIFEPFFSTKEGAEGGVGLGLAVVYGIVNRHGGTIDVDSRVGRGTTFRVHLPRRPPRDADGPDHADAPIAPAA